MTALENCVIALDGPSGAGKGLIGSMLAQKFSLKYFQSSSIYRMLASACLEKNINCDDESNILKLLNKHDLFDNYRLDLQTEEIGNYASKISTISSVRAKITEKLQRLILYYGRILMEGRDIGTVVAPNANLKIFLTANIHARAKRRYKQLCLNGKECIFDDVLSSMIERDQRDQKRSVAPLIQSKDAIIIDSSDLTPDQVIEEIISCIVNHKGANDLLKLFNLNKS